MTTELRLIARGAGHGPSLPVAALRTLRSRRWRQMRCSSKWWHEWFVVGYEDTFGHGVLEVVLLSGRFGGALTAATSGVVQPGHDARKVWSSFKPALTWCWSNCAEEIGFQLVGGAFLRRGVRCNQRINRS